MSSQSHLFPTALVESTPSPAIMGTSVPWYCYAVVLAVACVPIGVLWDISWHVSIGRDSFWNPAHVMIYLGGSIPGMICGWLVLKNTFWPDPSEASATVSVWGFRGPIGAWVVIWGAFMMLLSAPFDNWWHNAYGLDVQIISPPHTILALGTYAIAIGSLLLVVSWLNRAQNGNLLAANLLALFACGVLLAQLTIFLTEHSYPNSQHTADFYTGICRALPVYLIIAARVSKIRWSATLVSAMYMIMKMALIWVLPLFPAHPKLAPIYNPLTHMAPPPFPMLLIVPAFGIDLIMQTLGRKRGFWRETGLAFLLATVFFLLLLAVEWPFSEFLLSPGARNSFFGANMTWSYFDHLGAWCTQFWNPESHLTIKSSLIAIFTGAITARIALFFGNWLSEVKR